MSESVIERYAAEQVAAERVPTSPHHARGRAYARARLERMLQLHAEQVAAWWATRPMFDPPSDLYGPNDPERVTRRAADAALVAAFPIVWPRWSDRFDPALYVTMHQGRTRRISDDWAECIPPVAPLTRSSWDPITEAGLSGALLSYQARADRAAAAALKVKGKRGVEARRARFAALVASRGVRLALRAINPPVRRITPTEPPAPLFGCVPLAEPVPAVVDAFHATWNAHQLPDANVILATSLDPMGIHPWSLEIEHAGTDYLHGFGYRLTRPDVYVRRHGRHVARPDRVAFKGTARYALPQPCRYGRIGLHPSAEVNAETGVIEYLTTLKNHPAGCGETGNHRHAWRGHRRVTLALAARSGPRSTTRRALSAARAAAVATGAGARGPVAGPWTRDAANLSKAVAARGLADDVTRLESLVRTLSAERPVPTTDGASVTLTDSDARVTYRDVSYPVREWARRAALAGIDII